MSSICGSVGQRDQQTPCRDTKIWAAGDPRNRAEQCDRDLEAAGHLVPAWIWLEQLRAAGEQQGAFYESKRSAARYFYRFEQPTVHWSFDLLESLDRTTLDLDPACWWTTIQGSTVAVSSMLDRGSER